MKFFISYSRQDKVFAREFARHLQATYKHQNVWIDENMVREAGIEWQKEIDERIEESHIVICLLSSDFNQSEYCKRELRLAQQLRKYILPVIVRETPILDDLKRIQFIDMTNGITLQTTESLHARIHDLWSPDSQTNNVTLASSIGSLRVYKSRDFAREDIRRDLLDSGVTEIRILGISLNDFLDEKGHQYGTWEELRAYILSNEPRERDLDVKVLMIHPLSHGAQLREWGEVRDSRNRRLSYEVKLLAERLIDLEDKISQRKQASSQWTVNFKFRMYWTAPILFLCQTNKVSYVQQYHFWPTRQSNVDIPVMWYPYVDESEGTFSSMHSHLKAHFDWVWEKASIPAYKYFKQSYIGVDQGIGRSGIVNIFAQRQEGKKRILHLLRQAKEKVYIQGISLHSFFQANDLVTKSIEKLVSKGQVDVKILLLDPESDQAKYRSYREYRIKYRDNYIPFQQYAEQDDDSAENYHQVFSDLVQDTLNSRRVLMGINDIAQQNQNPKFRVHYYASAPVCFILIVDNVALVEQYHFGKLEDAVGRLENHNENSDNEDADEFILGKDMPLIEYEKDSQSLFKLNISDVDRSEYQLRDPYRLIENHFLFVFENFSWSAILPRESIERK
jgi:TIR domain